MQRSASSRNRQIDRDTPPTLRCCDVESTSLTLIQRRMNVVCQVAVHLGYYTDDNSIVKNLFTVLIDLLHM